MKDDFHLTMVGTGSAFGKKFHNNSCLIETKDYNLLIDCGMTVPLSLYQMKYDLSKIDGIFITHIHADHVNGLEEIAFQMMYRYRKRIDLIGEENLLQELWENSLRGGLRYTTEGYKQLHDFFEVIPIKREKQAKNDPQDPDRFFYNPIDISEDLTLEILRTPHIPQKDSFSVFINEEILYTGDVRFDEQLIYHADQERKVKLILHDCQLHDLSIVHASLNQLLTLPAEAQEKIYLMHYNDNMEDFVGSTGFMEFLEQHKRYHYMNGELR